VSDLINATVKARMSSLEPAELAALAEEGLRRQLQDQFGGGQQRPAMQVRRWTPEERQAYVYWDGSKFVAADPIKLHFELHNQPGFDLKRDVEDCKIASDFPQAVEGKKAAWYRILAAVRAAFGIPEYAADETGKVTAGLDAENLFGLLNDFMGFVNSQKKRHDTLPSSPSATAPASSENSITSNGAASTGTPTSSVSVGPPPSPSVPVSPSAAPLPEAIGMP
jgi:hypothetical protein